MIKPNQSQQEYLNKVVHLLRNAPPPNLSDGQRLNRMLALAHLAEYANDGMYAATSEEQVTPVFKNGKGVWCAVGHMLVKTGHAALATSIANDDNFIDLENIEDFNGSDFGLWAHAYGLERSETIIVQRYAPVRGR